MVDLRFIQDCDGYGHYWWQVGMCGLACNVGDKMLHLSGLWYSLLNCFKSLFSCDLCEIIPEAHAIREFLRSNNHMDSI